MEQSMKTRRLLTAHYQAYPQLQIQDIFKFLYQSAFGCEHMVSSEAGAVESIYRELDASPYAKNQTVRVESLDGAYSRVHLACLNNGLSAETLGKLFLLSAQKEPDGLMELNSKIETAKELANESVFGFSLNEFEASIETWKAQGFPAVRHSYNFRTLYHPAYRVVANKYVKFLPLFSEIDKLLEKGPAVVAVDGNCAGGKTTLSQMLSEIYDCTVFHMDDFFLRPEQRTAERYAEPGGNVDRERFLEEVLIPLKKKEPVMYREFDCSSMKLKPAVEVVPKRLTVVEGTYSMHPDLAGYYDLSVFLEISPELQRKRILNRNSPRFAERFFNEWIPLEESYFYNLNVRNRCSLSFQINE